MLLYTIGLNINDYLLSYQHNAFSSNGNVWDMIRINPPIPLSTPKGDAYAHFLIDYGMEEDLLWVCFINKTGECWTFKNGKIRLKTNYTFERK